MTLLEEIGQLLEDLGLGDWRPDGSPGGTIFHTKLPALPDAALAIALYGGGESSVRLSVDSPRLQVRCRGTKADSRIAERLGWQVYDTLHGLGYRKLAGGTELDLVKGRNSGPVYIGPDANGRDEYTVNFDLHLTRVTANRA